jgi:hypothetical protein
VLIAVFLLNVKLLLEYAKLEGAANAAFTVISIDAVIFPFVVFAVII